MAASDLFTSREEALLASLVEENVEFMIVGLAAAALQGVAAVTQDIDLWFEHPGDERMLRALRRVKASYIPPSNNNPPLLAGGGADLFAIVVHMHGLEPFDVERAGARTVQLGRVKVPVLPLARIIAGKEASGRPKDLAILPELRDALRTLEHRDLG